MQTDWNLDTMVVHGPLCCRDCRIGMPLYYCTNGHESHNRGNCPICAAPAGLHTNPTKKGKDESQ